MKYDFLLLFYCLNITRAAARLALSDHNDLSMRDDYPRAQDRMPIKIIRRAERPPPSSRNPPRSDRSRSSPGGPFLGRPTGERNAPSVNAPGPSQSESAAGNSHPPPRSPGVTFPWRQLPQSHPQIQFGSLPPPTSGSSPSVPASASGSTTASAPGTPHDQRQLAARVPIPLPHQTYAGPRRPRPGHFWYPNMRVHPSAFNANRFNDLRRPRPLPAAGPLDGDTSHDTSESSTPTQPGSPRP